MGRKGHLHLGGGQGSGRTQPPKWFLNVHREENQHGLCEGGSCRLRGHRGPFKQQDHTECLLPPRVCPAEEGGLGAHPGLVYTRDREDGRASCGSLGDPSDKNRGIFPSASARVICSDAPRFVRMRVSEVCRAGSLSQSAAHVTWEDSGHFNTVFNEGKKKKKKHLLDKNL